MGIIDWICGYFSACPQWLVLICLTVFAVVLLWAAVKAVKWLFYGFLICMLLAVCAVMMLFIFN